MSIRVVIVDDQAAMRTAFRTVLEAHGLAVVGEGGDGIEGVEVAVRSRPDVILMDVRMPRRDGLDATSELLHVLPEAKVLVLTTFDDDRNIDAALRAGACGFLTKNSTPEDLVRAVQRVAAGDTVLDPSVTARVLRRLPASGESWGDAAQSDALARLTERERDVLWLVSRGLTNAEVADRLGVGEATAKTHVSRVLMKLGVRDRVQAVIAAYECGFAPADRALGSRR